MRLDNKLKAIAAGVAGAIALSAAGLGFIAGKEGKENAPYQDIAGIWTVCYGSTGAHVVPGGVRTDEECMTLLRKDAQRFEAAVNRCTPAPKNQNQYDAMVSFSFNIGENAYCNSTFARKFNAGDVAGAAEEFPRWSYATVQGQRVRVQGLLNRRVAERALFLTPVPIVPEPADGSTFVPAVNTNPVQCQVGCVPA